jgi:hypothetical protein
MLSYLAILDYLNNSHDCYEEGQHVFEYEEGRLMVQVDDDVIALAAHACAIAYTLESNSGVVVDSGEVRTVKQLRQLHEQGWKIIEDTEPATAA